ncbi:MAG: hypothetical protein HY912_01565 [Desulfomonile tiedjei]|uniref:Uncharacterized protein n=1 Tax=Desulfomonile tiedjei TaxID=2358 RepID=A0A9D6V168_9BACT|nr:hypothetical protein [Desulfomonile tiedjei]
MNTDESALDASMKSSWVSVDLTCEPPVHVTFALMFQQGFMVRCRIGSTIREALCDQCGIEAAYLDGRINTVFLDGKPVDDVDTAKIFEESVLALSASMPGFAGAALRKGGFYARMRQGITYSEDADVTSHGEGFFILKLFNLVAEELGPHFLRDGVWLESAAFEEFFKSRAQVTRSRYLKLEVNHREVDCATLAEEEWSKKYRLIHLKVVTPGS